MNGPFSFETEIFQLLPELEEELDLPVLATAGGFAGEEEEELALGCPRPTRLTVSSFPRYSNAVSALPATEKAKVRNLAQLIARSFRRGCQPLSTLRLVGHADNDPVRERREPGFMLRISQARAQAVRQALERLINNRSILSQVRWDVQGAAGSQLIVPNPRTELERRRNRRVEVLVSTQQPALVCPLPPTRSRAFALWLQRALNRIFGTRLAENGTFDVPTRSALRTFQEQRGLAATGTIEPATHNALIAFSGLPVPCQIGPRPVCVKPLDAKAKQIINEAKKDKGNSPEEIRANRVIRAKLAVWKIIWTYYPSLGSLVLLVDHESELSCKERRREDADKPLRGLVTSYTTDRPGPRALGMICVGENFREGIDDNHFARRVLQVGHELLHIWQYRAAMADHAEREFLAHTWTALMPEWPGTGCVPPELRLRIVDCALRYWNCLSAQKQSQYSGIQGMLLFLRQMFQSLMGKTTPMPVGCNREEIKQNC